MPALELGCPTLDRLGLGLFKNAPGRLFQEWRLIEGEKYHADGMALLARVPARAH